MRESGLTASGRVSSRALAVILGILTVFTAVGLQARPVSAAPAESCAVGDQIWLDDNENGRQDDLGPRPADGTRPASSPRPIDMTIELLRDGDVIDKTITGFYDGGFVFDELPCGDGYRLRFSDLPDDYTFTEQHAGSDSPADSDPDEAGLTGTFSLGEGAEDNRKTKPQDGVAADYIHPAVDAGLVLVDGLCLIGDFAWLDENVDGSQDDSFPWPAVQATLLDPDGSPVPDVESDRSEDNGWYQLIAPCGSYRLKFEDDSGWRLTRPGVGDDQARDSDPDPKTGITDVITVGGELPRINTGVDVGVLPEGGACSIGGTVFGDADADGRFDQADNTDDGRDEGVEGIAVQLLDGDGTVVADRTTDESGKYRFAGRKYQQFCGTHRVQVHAPDGQQFTRQDVGDDERVDSDVNAAGLTGKITLSPADNQRSAVNAGLVPDQQAPTCAVGDRVWQDRNGNDFQDKGEPGAADIGIQLRSAGKTVASTRTAEDGAYVFDGLDCDRKYRLRVFDLPDGYWEFADADRAVDDDGQEVEGAELIDSDVDQQQENAPAVGLSDPFWLGQGREHNRPTEPADGVDADYLNPVVDAGIRKFTPICWVSGRVNEDPDGDGLVTGDGIAGVKLQLIDDSGAVLDRAESGPADVDNDAGEFSLSGACGSVRVRVLAPDRAAFTKPNVGDNEDLDSDVDADGYSSKLDLDYYGDDEADLTVGLILDR